MDSRCYRCASKFGVFKKETACGKCGFGFCKKCLPHQAKLLSSTDAVPVCSKCFQSFNDKSAKPAAQETEYDDVPENFKKRVAALKAKKGSAGKPAGPSNAASHGPPSGSAVDRDISARLQKLKEDRKKKMGPVASFEEMEERLRVLKGLPTQKEDSPANQVHHPPNTRTSHEQSQDLITQMQDEVKLDTELAGGTNTEETPCDVDPSELRPEGASKSLEDEVKGVMDEAKKEMEAAKAGSKRDAEMEERLASLHGMDVQTYRDKGRKELEEMSEEEQRKMYIAKLLEESRLDERMEQDGYSKLIQDSPRGGNATKPQSVDPDELPWCCICNEDAMVRCHDCDGDLYCKTCFREGHNEFDMKYHKTSRYRAPKDADR